MQSWAISSKALEAMSFLYPTLEEKAAHLLYFIIKDHPFSDGNKRIASLLFIHYLEKNNHLFKANGEMLINDNALVALALYIESSLYNLIKLYRWNGGIVTSHGDKHRAQDKILHSSSVLASTEQMS
jgi:prophage maintenance system killer protein